jgi:predicted metalloendopeptidase
MRHLKLILFPALLCCLSFAQQQPETPPQQPAETPEQAKLPAETPKLLPGFDINAIDKSVEPCQDFYQYACGTWLKDNPVPADKASFGRFTELFDRNREILHQILEKYSNPANQKTPVEQKIGDYYAACMDTKAINDKGLAPIQPELDRINAMKTKADLPAELAHLHSIGVDALFGFDSEQDFKNSNMMIAGTYQAGQGLPERDYYFKTDDKSLEQRNQYVYHIRKMLELLGDKPETAATEAATVMAIETNLAAHSLTRADARDPQNIYHFKSVAELQQMDPSFDWKKYLADRDVNIKDLNVAMPGFVEGMQKALDNYSLDDWKTYLRWQLVHSQAMFLPEAFDKENFHFYGTVLRGTKEQEVRWKRCVSSTDGDLGEALGQKYVEETFGAQGKARTLKMIKALEVALKEDITNLDWMSDTTKKQALIKLDAIANKIGYPEKWRDYSKLNIVRGDALGNSLRANAFEEHRQLAKIGKPVDKLEWQMTPPTVNAYYDPQMNNINFPAGILQPPFYDNKMDDAVNFGGIGAVIGHELTHGFDNQGSQFDAEGNFKNWWTPEDHKEFTKRTDCIVNEYNDFIAYKDPNNPKNDIHTNGKLTLGENTADNGGLRIAIMALENTLAGQSHKEVDGYTPEQRAFLSWGQIWCTNYRPDAARTQALSNEHSIAPQRVNGVVSNMPEFEKAFSCKRGDPMVRENACHVW